MTSELRVCAWCGKSFEQRSQRGPAPRYCRRTCRQRAYEHRRSSGPLQPSPAATTAALAALATATDAGAAVSDVPVSELRAVLAGLVSAADRVLAETGHRTVAVAGAERAEQQPASCVARSAASPAERPALLPAAPAGVGDVVYRRRPTPDGNWVVERCDLTADNWLSRPLDPRATSPYPWTTDGRRSLIKALLSDVLDVARHGATLPIRGGDTLLDGLADGLLPVADTGFDLDRHRIEGTLAARWTQLMRWLNVDEQGRRSQWRLVEIVHDDSGTPTAIPSRPYDRLHEAKRSLRRLRAELTRQHPERRAHGHRFEIEELPGAGSLVVTPPLQRVG